MDQAGPVDEARALRLAKLFDLRTFIGALFVVFGLVVTLEGLTASDAEIAKASGLNLSLWTGLAMLVVAVGFIAWMLATPPSVQRTRPQDGDQPADGPADQPGDEPDDQPADEPDDQPADEPDDGSAPTSP